MYKKILYFLSLIPLTLSQTNETDTTQTVIQADYNEHNYIMSQVIINKEFDPDTMTKESDWSSNFELDISNTLGLPFWEIDRLVKSLIVKNFSICGSKLI